MLLSTEATLSSDRLTLLRIIRFKDEAAMLEISAAQFATFPGLFEEKDAYNALHGHIETKVYTTE